MSGFKFGTTGITGGSGKFYMPNYQGNSLSEFGAMRFKYFNHPGNTGTYSKTVSVVSDFGLATQGGMLFYHVHNWPNDRSFGMVYWQNPGNSNPLSSVGQNKIHENGVNVDAVVSSTDHCIQFNVTNGHNNSHGHQFMVWGGR